MQKKFFTVVKILEKNDRTCVYLLVIANVVEWLECQNCNQHGLNSKPIHIILLYFWERHFMAHFLAWWSWQAVLNFSHIFIKLKKQNKNFQVDSNILASPEAGWGNCLLYVLALLTLFCESKG